MSSYFEDLISGDADALAIKIDLKASLQPLDMRQPVEIVADPKAVGVRTLLDLDRAVERITCDIERDETRRHDPNLANDGWPIISTDADRNRLESMSLDRWVDGIPENTKQRAAQIDRAVDKHGEAGSIDIRDKAVPGGLEQRSLKLADDGAQFLKEDLIGKVKAFWIAPAISSRAADID